MGLHTIEFEHAEAITKGEKGPAKAGQNAVETAK